MKQQVNPAVAAGISVAALVVIGLVIYLFNNRTPAPEAPRQPANTPAPVRNMSPDEQVKMRMQQMQQGGTGR